MMKKKADCVCVCVCVKGCLCGVFVWMDMCVGWVGRWVDIGVGVCVGVVYVC